MKFYIIFVFSLIVLILGGCGNGHVGLRGKVVFSDDGSPLTIGTVCFATPTFQAKGDLDKNGNFVMGSYSDHDGLPLGTYQVGILNAVIDTEYSLVAPQWLSPKTSGYTVKVDKKTSYLEIKVDRNPIPPPKS